MHIDTSRAACPSPHSRWNKIGRVFWALAWWLLFRPSPRILFAWRVAVLKLFGAQVTWRSRVDPTVRIWAPWNLSIGNDTSIGHHADIYNVAKITLGDRATVSQYSYLCAASHDINDPAMVLTSKPIMIQDESWVCAKAFVGPGVVIGQGAVLGACAVVVKDVAPWEVMVGNPATFLRTREVASTD